MFDKRLANLCDNTFDDDGDAVVEDPSRWQPLTNVSGQLVERKRDNSTATFFNNVEIDRLIDNLQHSYQHQLSSFTSSSLSPPVEKDRNGSSSSSGGRHAPQQHQPAYPVSPNSNKSNATSRSQNSRNWRKEKLLAKVDSLSKDHQQQFLSARALLPDRKSIAKELRGSDPDLPKEHLDSLYEDLLDAVIAEIHDNQNFLEESCRHRGTSPLEAHYLPHPARATPPGGRSTTVAGDSTGNNGSAAQNQISTSAVAAATTANLQRKGSNPKSPKAGTGGGGNFHLSSPSHINSIRAKRDNVLNEHFDDQLLQVSLPDDLEMENEENAFNQSTYGNIGIQVKTVPRSNNVGNDDLDELKTEDILSHPVVQSLLSEEKVKRWALLKSLYDREATLEKQIESLQSQLRDQTQLANHFKRMQQELITSHCEKENLWEKERQKLVEKLKSGQKKMVFCSKLIFYLLEKERRDKEDQNSEPEASKADATVDMNKNEVYKYHILNDEDPSSQENKNSFPFQSNFIFSQKPSIDPKNSSLSSNIDGNAQIYPHPTVETNQSELSIISESEALIKHRSESAVKNGAFPCSLNKTDGPGFSNRQDQLPSWNSNFVNTELAPLKKMVSNCRANAEKQCRMLRQMFPEAAAKSASIQKQVSSRKETTKKLAKSFTFPNSNNAGGNSSNESSDDGSDCEQTSHGVVLRSKSFSSSLGLGGNNRGSEPEMTSTIDNHHLNFFRPFDANATLSMSNSSHMSCSAGAISQPPSATSCQDDLPMTCNDPFDLDLKVKYCSSENIMHAMQTCSLNSPLISPCSSFDEGLASGTSSHTALFGSGIIVSSTATPNPANCDSPSPVNKTFAQPQTAPNVAKKHSVCNAPTTDYSTSAPRSVRSLSTCSAPRGVSKQLSNESAQEFLACNAQNVTSSQTGTGNGHRRVDSASQWGGRSEQEGSDPNESLMIFDSSNDSMNAACSVIKDFDPLDSHT